MPTRKTWTCVVLVSWTAGVAGAMSSCGGVAARQPVSCALGLHDGGDGKCVPAGSCSAGYYDDGTGACRLVEPGGGLTDTYLPATPNREMDLVFAIDNSVCMAGKVTKLNAQFPTLLAALWDPVDGTLPDLRIALIDGDLGTGCAFSSGSCAARNSADAGGGCWGDQGAFQMLSSPTACTFNEGARYLEYAAGAPVNYTGDISTVFACLASNLGTGGCGYQHLLQAFEFALIAKGIGNEEQQAMFLRPDALLGLVFLTDEDDCSAALNTGLLQAQLPGEYPTLRCATRGHACGGKNLAEAPPGYPTVAAYSHPLVDCQARADTCPNQTDGYAENTDASEPTACAPLKNLKKLAEEIKALKADPDQQILVAGIFGWPRRDADLATAEYKIAPIPNPNVADTQHPTVYSVWPVCYVPDHLPSATPGDPTGFDGSAAGWAAMPGLRNAAFVDEFGDNGLKLSICERDFSAAMTTIGERLAAMAFAQCYDFKLADADPATPGVQPECTMSWSTGVLQPSGALTYQDGPVLPVCAPGAVQGGVPEDCWRFVSDLDRCPTHGQRLEVLRTSKEIAASKRPPPGTKIHVRCRTCADATAAGCGH